MTDVQVINDAINTIEGLFIPISMIDSVGAQLNRVRKNLTVLYRSIEENINKQQTEESVQEPPELEIVQESEE